MAYRNVFGDGGLGSISGVVSALPAGYRLGEERILPNGDYYELFYNACNQQISKGFAFARNQGSAAAAGPYSCTVTTVTEVAYNAAGMCVHATATTGTYFWGLVQNVASGVALVGATAVAAGGMALQLAANGQFTNGTTQAVGYTVTTGTTGTLSGSYYVNFRRVYTQ